MGINYRLILSLILSTFYKMSDKPSFVTIKEFEEYKKSMEKKLETKKEETKKEKTTRAPNSYNLYMKDKIADMKKTDPTISNKEAFKKGAEMWNKDKLEKATT